MEIKCQLDATDDFYCRSYCLLNMFRAPLCPSSGLCVRFAGCCCSRPQTGNITLSSTPYRQLENQSTKYDRQHHLYNTLELLMMGIMVPETCWASNKICNKNHLLHLVGILCPHINDDARSKPHKILCCLSVASHRFQNVLLVWKWFLGSTAFHGWIERPLCLVFELAENTVTFLFVCLF